MAAILSGEQDTNELMKRFMSGFIIGGAGVLGGPALAGITNALIEVSNQTREACAEFDKAKVFRAFVTGFLGSKFFPSKGYNDFGGIFKSGVAGGMFDTIASELGY